MTEPGYFYRTLFWAVASVGRPLGGIPPRRLTLSLARRAYGSQKPEPDEYRWLRDRDGLEFYLHPYFINDLQILAFGRYEPHLQKVIRSLLRPGMVCVDIGANAGFVALHMGKMVRPQGRVYAFEPVPFLFQKLIDNIARNLLDDTIEPRRSAVSNAPGYARMHVRDEWERNQGLSLLASPVSDQPGSGARVECTSLDALVAQERLDRLDFVKIDVQGAEALVIEGARACLERFGPDIVMELSSGLSPLGRSAADTVRLMEQAGYSVFELGADPTGRPLNASALAHGSTSWNVLCRRAG